jgi:LysM repeat protein
MKIKQITIYFTLLVVPVLWGLGQNYPPPTRMAGGGTGTASLAQDVALLKEQLGEMRFEVERLLRENESLQLRIKKVEAQSASSVSDVAFRQELSSLYAEINRLNKTQRDELLAQISKQIRALAKEIEKSPNMGGDGSGSSTPIVFDPNSYPQTGIPYIVKSGDTLSKIASSVGSKVSYIIHANEIPDPDRLKIGRELFLPIDNPN